MYLLDTNVLSECMRPCPAAQVVAWLDGCKASDLFVSAITQAEILLGVSLLPEGKRRALLQTQAQAMFEQDFQNRCLAFDAQAAVYYARVVQQRRQAGAPISTEDAQIAAIALAAGMTLVTRSGRDFSGVQGLELLNPWG